METSLYVRVAEGRSKGWVREALLIEHPSPRGRRPAFAGGEGWWPFPFARECVSWRAEGPRGGGHSRPARGLTRACEGPWCRARQLAATRRICFPNLVPYSP